MKKLLVILLTGTLAVTTLPGLAEGGVTLSALKPTVPGAITLTRADGTVVGKEVPVSLPEGETLPTLKTKLAQFDIPPLKKEYPQIDHMTNLDALPYSLIINRTPENGSRMGEPRRSDESWMIRPYAVDTQAENNPLPPEAPLELAKSILALGGVEADVRLHTLLTQGPLYFGRDIPGVNPYQDRVSFRRRQSAIDLTRPVKGYQAGLYSTFFAQYLAGTQIFTHVYVLDDTDELGNHQFFAPPSINVHMLSDQDYVAAFEIMEVTDTLVADTSLAPFSAIEQVIQQRIDAGLLTEVYEITLGYTVQLNANLPYACISYDRTIGDQRFVLRPCWRVRGYDKRFEQPGYREIRDDDAPLTPLEYAYLSTSGPGCSDYDLRIDAITGELITTYDQLLYRD